MTKLWVALLCVAILAHGTTGDDVSDEDEDYSSETYDQDTEPSFTTNSYKTDEINLEDLLRIGTEKTTILQTDEDDNINNKGKDKDETHTTKETHTVVDRDKDESENSEADNYDDDYQNLKPSSTTNSDKTDEINDENLLQNEKENPAITQKYDVFSTSNEGEDKDESQTNSTEITQTSNNKDEYTINTDLMTLQNNTFSLDTDSEENISETDVNNRSFDKKSVGSQSMDSKCIDIRKCPYYDEIHNHYLKNKRRYHKIKNQYLKNKKYYNETEYHFLETQITCWKKKFANVFCGYNLKKIPKVRCRVNKKISENSLICHDDTHTVQLPKPPNCGQSSLSKKKQRVMGGSNVKPGEMPWMAAIGKFKYILGDKNIKWFCTGFLITERHVITAAHCGTDIEVVRLGETNLTTEEGSGDYGVVRVTPHADYNDSRRHRRNDISLIYLDKIVTYTENIQPLCITSEEFYSKTDPIVAGWGVSDKVESFTALQGASVDFKDFNTCMKNYGNINISLDSDQQLCAGTSKRRGRDACSGDSGGPLILPRKEGNDFYFHAIGVVSFGIKPEQGCVSSKLPGVYSKISYFTGWITDRVAEPVTPYTREPKQFVDDPASLERKTVVAHIENFHAFLNKINEILPNEDIQMLNRLMWWKEKTLNSQK